jgi:peptidoglycan hydrolase-like protein with peptidoglycan-binding domain
LQNNAQRAANPTEYWKYPKLSLSKGSIDNKRAKAKRVRANVPHDYVSDMQKDLITLGYLSEGGDDGDYGGGTRRAVERFQRHANRKFRMTRAANAIVTPWGGTVNGICNQNTAKEIRLWIARGFRLPLGIHKLVKIDGGTLRADAAQAWTKALAEVKRKGGTLVPSTSPKYSDTIRYVRGGYKTKAGKGNSRVSLHYTGRAVDLNQDLGGGKGQRWWIVKDVVGGDTFWTLYCKTDKQDGSQGTKIATKSKKHYVFWRSTGEKWMPEGHYLDMTAILSSHHFERIKAQDSWSGGDRRSEWWHFFYSVDVQKTFLDEMELIGVAEKDLRKAGWTVSDLDRAPG